MKQKKFSGKHLSFIVMAFAMVASLAMPLTTTFAATAVNRSVELSSSSIGATGVQYKVKFTTGATPAAAMVVYFCNNSPLKEADCIAPAGFSAASAATSTSGFTVVNPSANRLEVTGTFAASSDIEVILTGITNPNVSSVTAPLYARVVTYASTGAAETSTAASYGAGVVDDGAMAIAITSTVGVSGVVLESLTFCVSGGTALDPLVSPIGDGCSGTLIAPTLNLGQSIGGVVSLQPGVVSNGTIHTQISTNASKGAVVRLKSSTTGCGGLMRAGAVNPDACSIAPAQQTDIVAGDAKFGVRTNAPTDGSDPIGTYRPYEDGVLPAYYSNGVYSMRYVVGDEDGVTSPFGDPFLDTAEAPASNKNMALTFAAAASNNTPAGSYSADISLIAVGKF